MALFPKSSLFLFSACALLAQSAVPARVGVGMVQRKLSLKEAVTQALSHNLEVEIQKTQVASASAAERGARGFYDPSFRWAPDFEARNTPAGSLLQGADGKLAEHFHNENFYFRQKLPFQGTSLGVDFVNSRSSSSNPFFTLNPLTSSQLLFSFTQPLLRNRVIDADRAQLQIRRKQLQISETEFRLKAIEIIVRTEQAYWDLVAARQDAQVKQEAVELAREQLARNRRMIDAGTLAPVELSASEAELERRLDTWYSAVGVITEAENLLKSLLAGGRDEEIWKDEIIPTDENTLAPPETGDLPGAVAEALRQRPELEVVAGQQQINQVEQRQNADQVKPMVNLNAGYGSSGLGGSIRPGIDPFTQSSLATYTRLNQLSELAGLAPITIPNVGGVPGSLVGGYGTTLSNLFGGRYQSVQVGLSLDLTIRNRTAEANLAQSAIGERRLKLQKRQVEQVIEMEVRNAMQALETARQRRVAAEAGARAAREKLESETRLFQTGESTNFLVLTRQNEYADSRHRELVARLDFNKAVARLQQAIGSTLQSHRITLK
ncbi:MAG TPA: TolC family protein [Bryobacteraceae bacterium]|jgi:HAE1 family hydrophobic/amphiphilic exporter-1|nr:TolC family protein [Bryobacteraceae bacterium]